MCAFAGGRERFSFDDRGVGSFEQLLRTLSGGEHVSDLIGTASAGGS